MFRVANEAINARRLRDRRALPLRFVDEAVLDHSQELLAEVPRIERLPADRLVDRTELLDRERLRDELEGDRRTEKGAACCRIILDRH